ncbi:MAG: fused MFS/spermidine synthase [Acidobacteriaceae bacterium]|nr:fused MFS/spermidine synthase [Acidobacteriaceae bacterium]MBV9502658.1 fused MFS/spermidine synthase [Acidobacteriaceae bacterium]
MESETEVSAPRALNSLLCGTAIFLSAFLLFSLEPLIAKRIIPWFGGSAAVWTVCLVFYQIALLLGYVYARAVARRLTPRMQSILHILLLLASLTLLPIGPGAGWKPAPSQDPTWLILLMLTATIGLPFVVLSATSPLLQYWLARGGHSTPYSFFAFSNFASFAALIAYPLGIEPTLDVNAQSRWWSVLYTVFVVACGISAWQSRSAALQLTASTEHPPLKGTHEWIWFTLAACGSMLLLAVTNHIDENVAAVPLLWVLPLAVYLLSFVFAFSGARLYRRSLWLRVLAFSLGILGYAIYNINEVQALQISIPIFLAGLFVCCLFCHAELYRLRPDASDLTRFYLIVAAGGAGGAIFVGLIAPRIFSGIYELPLALSLTAALALLLTWSEHVWSIRLLWVGVSAAMCAVFAANIAAYHQNALALRRSFYGSLRVVQSRHAGPEQTRTLFHGTIEHGAQFLLPPRRSRPTTYYGPDSGIGILLRECFPPGKRVGIVGLGVGTVAAYGQPGDTFRFYEINPQVIEIAESLFFYLRQTPSKVQIVEGDGRLSLEPDTSPPFDVLALDAFSGDAIPVHLLTAQAMTLYQRHVRPNGAIAFHVSNNYLDLAPVVRRLAQSAGYKTILIHNHGEDEESILPADWVIVTNNETVLADPALKLRSRVIAPRPGLRLWTDTYNDLLQTLKTPRVH